METIEQEIINGFIITLEKNSGLYVIKIAPGLTCLNDGKRNAETSYIEVDHNMAIKRVNSFKNYARNNEI